MKETFDYIMVPLRVMMIFIRRKGIRQKMAAFQGGHFRIFLKRLFYLAWVNLYLDLKQLLCIGGPAILILFLAFLLDPNRASTDPDESNYIGGKLDVSTLNFMKEKEDQQRAREEEYERQEQQREREREARAAERKRRIDGALSSRRESTINKKCKSCGAVFGTGTTCQYCGQP